MTALNAKKNFEFHLTPELNRLSCHILCAGSDEKNSPPAFTAFAGLANRRQVARVSYSPIHLYDPATKKCCL